MTEQETTGLVCGVKSKLCRSPVISLYLRRFIMSNWTNNKGQTACSVRLIGPHNQLKDIILLVLTTMPLFRTLMQGDSLTIISKIFPKYRTKYFWA